MCPPLAIAGFAVNAASQVLAFQAQNAQQKAQVTAHNANLAEQKRAWEDANKAAGKSLADQTSQEGVRVQQEQQEATEKMLSLRREAMQIKGDVLASSVNGGQSEEMLLLDAERQRASYSDIIANNVRNVRQQSAVNVEGMRAEAESRSNASMPRGSYQSFTKTSSGSGLALGLGILGAGIGAYNDYHIKPVKGTVKTAGTK